MLITKSLLCDLSSALDLYCKKCICAEWSVFSITEGMPDRGTLWDVPCYPIPFHGMGRHDGHCEMYSSCTKLSIIRVKIHYKYTLELLLYHWTAFGNQDKIGAVMQDTSLLL